MSIFTLSVLHAGDGDCLVVTWGDPGALHHAVIDGGRAGAYVELKPMLKSMAANSEPLELFVLTHIDADHVAGALSMIRDDTLPIEPAQVWFNGYDQMNGLEAFGERQGDEYSAALLERDWPLNSPFTEKFVSVETSPGVIDIAGLRITMLSPDIGHLRSIRSRWADWRSERAARATRRRQANEAGDLVSLGRSPMPDPLLVEELAKPGKIDSEPPNGSSIAFVAEWAGQRMLLAGDAHPDVLATAIRPLAEAEGGRFRVDVMKVSHHGSKGNTTSELLDLIDCSRFVFSTNGNLHGHPDPETIARILMHRSSERKELIFNYPPKGQTRPWDVPKHRDKWNFTCVWPPVGDRIQIVDLMRN